LREADTLISTRSWHQLGEEAHTLAGSAGMFGFERLAGLGRRFARAVQSAPAEVASLAEGLRMSLEITLKAIDRCTLVGLEV
jgi:HPt (histidine-containing phosphotransfer) domain-containing protein